MSQVFVVHYNCKVHVVDVYLLCKVHITACVSVLYYGYKVHITKCVLCVTCTKFI